MAGDVSRKAKVLIRVLRPNQSFPIRAEYSRWIPGRQFIGEKIYWKVSDEDYARLDDVSRQGAIPESQLRQVREDPIFHLEDPYVEPGPTPVPQEDPRAVAERRAREAGERAVKDPPAADWDRPKPPPPPVKVHRGPGPAPTEEEAQEILRKQDEEARARGETPPEKPQVPRCAYRSCLLPLTEEQVASGIKYCSKKCEERGQYTGRSVPAAPPPSTDDDPVIEEDESLDDEARYCASPACTKGDGDGPKALTEKQVAQGNKYCCRECFQEHRASQGDEDE